MAKIYLSPAAHAHDNPCSYDRKNCGENVHCNRYMDELEPYLRACGFEVKRADKGNTGDGIRVSVREANDWGRTSIMWPTPTQEAVAATGS